MRGTRGTAVPPPRTSPVVEAGVQEQDEAPPRLTFVRPIPGFAAVREFVLVRMDDQEPPALYELRSWPQPQVRFLVAPPTMYFPDYEFDLTAGDCQDLGLEQAQDALALVVLSTGAAAPEDPQQADLITANLLAPIVVNVRTRQAAQLILSGTEWPVRARLG